MKSFKMNTPIAVKRSVRDFYEKTGWGKNARGTFADAEKFEDLRPVSAEYRSRCLLRVNGFLTTPGKFLLDVASGPIQHPEHISYSDNYDRRICADISLNALREAKSALHGRCRCVQCDIVNLPFKDDTVDGVVSLHTIYHVPADEQPAAFLEIVRVLTRDHSAVVVYTWGNKSLLTAIGEAPLFPFKFGRKCIRGLLKRFKMPGILQTNPPPLYFHPLTRKQLLRELSPFTRFDIRVWRSLSVTCMKLYFHPRLLGRFLLRVVFKLENLFPRFMGRFGAYPLIVFKK